MGYLFGSILTVSKDSLGIIFVLDILIVLLAIIFYEEILAISFDETFAIIRNLPVEAIYLGLMAAVALTVVMLMQVVGLIMVIALLTIPAAISGQYVKNIKLMIIFSSLLGSIFTTIGLALSYRFNLTSGATIILVAGIAYLISLGLKPIFLKVQGNTLHPRDNLGNKN